MTYVIVLQAYMALESQLEVDDSVGFHRFWRVWKF